MRCKYCKKGIKEDSPMKVGLSFVHNACVDDFITFHLNKVKKKKKDQKEKFKEVLNESKKNGSKQHLWTKYFSPFIRQRDANSDGMCYCISCNKKGHWTSMHAGHFIPKSAGEFFYFNEDNVYAQCPKCNIYGSQDTGANYEINLRKRVGDSIVDSLLKAKGARKNLKRNREDYVKMQIEYKKKLSDLQNKAASNVTAK